jgi:Flp pilus assembly pilin Flp
MPLATRRFAPAERARLLLEGVLMAPANALSSQPIIPIHPFCLMPRMRGRQAGVIRPRSQCGFSKMTLFKNNRGAAAVEFALMALPVMEFIIGIIQFGWVVWVDNLLHISVDTASRCGAVGSTTSPCGGAGQQ